MSVDLNDEIVQDFLVEAGEILDSLGEQLVDLEMRPDDSELLNSVFRGFHTIKGGAGFLALDNLVEISHKAEDVFDLLRQGERAVDSALMDVILKVIDILNDMFDEIRSGEEPEPAEPDVIRDLKILASGGEIATDAETPIANESKPADKSGSDNSSEKDITDDEFEELLDAISDSPKEKEVSAVPVESSDISEDEFDALLDEIHGKGKMGHIDAAPEKKSKDDGLISEDEFDALLDELHGKNKPITGTVEKTEEQTDKVEASKPKPKPKPKKQSKEKSKKASAAIPQAEATVRVETSVLDDIMNMVGEMVLVRNRMKTLEIEIDDESLSTAIANLDMVTSDLQTAAMKTRMQPIKKVFGRFPRVVRDLARSLNKEIDLVMSGEDTDLDKNLVEALADPMVHLVRNSVDHGIEMPDDREASGKSRRGEIKLSALTEGDHILLKITDDGAGMDADVLRGKAVEKGVMDEEAASRLSNRECYELIFAAGFSTKEQISDVSGRGVGMDVVKTRINQLNGTVEIDSNMGTGTIISIKLPLTLAIMPTLMVILRDQIFALPLVNVNEIIDFDAEQLNVIDGQQVMLVRGKPLPLFYLSRWLVKGVSDKFNEDGHVVIVNVGTQRIGLLVDNLIGQEEVVIKPLGAMLQGIQGLSGATITGDGRIAMILDLPSLTKYYANHG